MPQVKLEELVKNYVGEKDSLGRENHILNVIYYLIKITYELCDQLLNILTAEGLNLQQVITSLLFQLHKDVIGHTALLTWLKSQKIFVSKQNQKKTLSWHYFLQEKTQTKSVVTVHQQA